MTVFDDITKHTDGISMQLVGRVVSYTPKGGDAGNITACQGETSITGENDEQGSYQMHESTLEISLDDIPSPQDGDIVEIDGVVWDVDGNEGKDESESMLKISRRTDEKRHAQDFHRRNS